MDARIANLKKPKPFDKCLIADMLISVERYPEAEDALESIKMPLVPDDDLKGMYAFEKISLYLYTGRFEQATEIFSQNQKFLDIYFTSPARKRMSGAYFDNSACIFAINGDAQGANHYLSLEKQFCEKYEVDFSISWKITNVSVLKFLGSDDLQTEYEKVHKEIAEHEGFKMAWQKQHYLKLLSQAFKDFS